VSCDDDAVFHIPVLLDQAIEALVVKTDGIYIDGTLGGGGHSQALLNRLGPDGAVFGFDQDIEALDRARALLRQDARMSFVHSNVVHLKHVLSRSGVSTIDGILLDLGVSSHQIDEARRGFSFRADGPLDMRMNRDTVMTAADIIAASSENELADILFTWGEERHSRRIARAIKRRATAIERTEELRDIIAGSVSPAHLNKTLARVFQALRIAVNDELRILSDTLRDTMDMLAVGGRIVVISYHSLEDRIVKQFLKKEAADCVCPPGLPICVCDKVSRIRILTKRHIEANEDEIRRNPRARSARLRAGQKIHA
jgi:16S rRNA (cytosine1402-N4)-methyltransferase